MDPQLSIQNYESHDYEKLKEYQHWMVQALRTAFPKQKTPQQHPDKVYEVHQHPSESPSIFLECLCQVFWKYSDLNQEDPENQRTINMLFIGQSAPDITIKLQKLDVVTTEKTVTRGGV